MKQKLGTLSKIDRKKLAAIETWIWRRIEKISWTDHVPNETVLQLVQEKRTLLVTITQRQKNWVGHVL